MKQGLSFLIVVLALSITSASAATFSVINTNDAGRGSLRQAMLDANAQPGADDIRFDLPGTPPFSIAPKSALPTVTDTLTVDATTQNGFAGKPVVELDGHLAGASASGFVLNAPSCVVRGLVINRFAGAGILAASGSNSIQGNFIGTDITGIARLANRGDGINLSNSASNVIGGATSGTGNLISGNLGNGVQVSGTNSTGNRILGNFIGTDVIGTTPLGNGSTGQFGLVGNGVFVNGGQRNQVGGVNPGERNVIGANSGDGVKFLGNARSNVVQGNFIGVDVSGTRGVGNTRVGVWIENSAANLIGGNVAAARNLISSNGIYGVGLYLTGASNNIMQGNFIGTDVTGTNALGNVSHGIYVELANRNTIGGVAASEANTIAFNLQAGVDVLSGTSNRLRGNRIFDNGTLGIDLALRGVNPNDVLDADAGANLRQNYPTINSIAMSAGGTLIEGFLASRANTAYDLDFYANDVADSTGYGEGQNYLTSQRVTTGASGIASFSVLVSSGLASNQFITATATDAADNTSEFSLAAPLTNFGDTYSYAGHEILLPEVRAALQGEFGGTMPPAFTETQDTTYAPTTALPATLQFRFLADTGGFQFQFGIYRITPELAAMDLSTDDARIAYARAALAASNAVVAIDDRTTNPNLALTITNLVWNTTDRLGFFLIPDSTLQLFQTQPDTFALYGGGSETLGYQPGQYSGRRWPLFSEWRANPGGKDQLLNFTGVSKITKRQVSLFAWEDLTRAAVPALTSDTRFNDLIFTVEGVDTASLPVGEPPTIAKQPRSQVFVPGATVAFDVVANGTPPLNYQWLRNGQPLRGETNSTLSVTNAKIADAGIYSVNVSNAAGSVISERATLALAGCVPTPTGLIAWWPGDGNANDLAGTNHGTLRNGAGFAPGIVGQAFALDGVDDFVSIPHAAALNP
ncbi:MAG: immunoglobulin domain-containing protein, partial [Verrucomicrobia bacterium]|nr:immunoglobulin domain-containing protein [Verrucomicrobiota bacterium]